jgi:RNA polymerase sigma-70 factor (ECF subfamily)
VQLASFSVLMGDMGSTSEPLAPASLDTEQFTEWYRSTLPRVYGYLYKATGGDRPRTENITQETFLQAVRTLQHGGHRTVTVPWLLSVARSRLIDAARSESRAERKLKLVHNRSSPDVDLSGIDLPEVNAKELLAGLRPLERMALALRYVDDLPVAQVALQLERSVRATESLLARSRRRLRDLLEEMTDA